MMKARRGWITLAVVIWSAAFQVQAGSEEPCEEKSPSAISLFNGDDLGDWKVVEFDGTGDVHVAFDGSLTLESGVPLTGVVWSGAAEMLPKCGYEITLEAKKHYGEDFFCALTFPVKEAHATFVCGGWGGSVVGISSIDGLDAAVNETSRSLRFESGRWYAIRLRVTGDRMTGWVDGVAVFDVELDGRTIGLRPGPIAKCAPLGIATYLTRAAFRNIHLRRLGP